MFYDKTDGEIRKEIERTELKLQLLKEVLKRHREEVERRNVLQKELSEIVKKARRLSFQELAKLIEQLNMVLLDQQHGMLTAPYSLFYSYGEGRFTGVAPGRKKDFYIEPREKRESKYFKDPIPSKVTIR